eukprot:3834312-Prymnesium_polylepis.1
MRKGVRAPTCTGCRKRSRSTTIGSGCEPFCSSWRCDSDWSLSESDGLTQLVKASSWRRASVAFHPWQRKSRLESVRPACAMWASWTT